jgi:nitrate reductase gamma subunit
MWRDSLRIALAASHWVAAVLMMIMASLDSAKLVLAGWSVLAALAGCVFIVWQLLTHERIRVETICHLALGRDDDDGLRSVRDR